MTIHHDTETATPDATKRYPSDLNDQEFDLVAPLVAQKAASGKKRIVDIREVLNAIFYRIRTGCQWRMLPSDFPIWYHVWYYERKWRNDGTLQRINTCWVEKSVSKQIVTQNQVLPLSIAKVLPQRKWVAKKDLTHTNR